MKNAIFSALLLLSCGINQQTYTSDSIMPTVLLMCIAIPIEFRRGWQWYTTKDTAERKDWILNYLRPAINTLKMRTEATTFGVEENCPPFREPYCFFESATSDNGCSVTLDIEAANAALHVTRASEKLTELEKEAIHYKKPEFDAIRTLAYTTLGLALVMAFPLKFDSRILSWDVFQQLSCPNAQQIGMIFTTATLCVSCIGPLGTEIHHQWSTGKDVIKQLYTTAHNKKFGPFPLASLPFWGIALACLTYTLL